MKSKGKFDYVFGKTLGAGSFGVVRQARKLSTDENVAVKILLKKALHGNAVQLKMLYDELTILQKCHHSNIVKFKDWFETNDKFYIVTQLATGGELFDRIVKRGKFTEVDAVAILIQILKAVEYIHSMNIVHRDLKPENLLYVDKSDKSPLVLADFGIAKELKSGDDLIFKAAGSLGYVAPEVLTSNGHGKPCDIWSIGVITYTLLSGYSAFVADSVDGFLNECTAHEHPVVFHKPYWDNISQEAKNFILTALDLDPETRPTATELLKDPWITSKELQKTDLLPTVKKGFDARRKFKEAVEIVKLNNRIQRLRQMYCMTNETDSDLEGNRSSSAINLLSDKMNGLRIHRENAKTPLSHESEKKSEGADDDASLKSALTQDAFAQIVRAAAKNKEKIIEYQKSEAASQANLADENKAI